MSMTGEKQARQSALLKIVRTRATANQRQIADWLGKAGFEATQASISRDVRELGLVKMAGRYLRPDAAGTYGHRAHYSQEYQTNPPHPKPPNKARVIPNAVRNPRLRLPH